MVLVTWQPQKRSHHQPSAPEVMYVGIHWIPARKPTFSFAHALKPAPTVTLNRMGPAISPDWFALL